MRRVAVGLMLWSWGCMACAVITAEECRSACRPRPVAAYEASVGRSRCECWETPALVFEPKPQNTVAHTGTLTRMAGKPQD